MRTSILTAGHRSIALLSSFMIHSGSIFVTYASSNSLSRPRLAHPIAFVSSIKHGEEKRNARRFSATTDSISSGTTDESVPPAQIFSTMTLLEHININIPDHTLVLPFYLDILGFGLDPRRAANVAKGSGTLWVNCGASQIHLPYGDVPQAIPGSIGLRYDDLGPLKERLISYGENGDVSESRPFREYAIGTDPSGTEHVRIEDGYGNVFYCREKKTASSDINDISSLIHTAIQPVLVADNAEHREQFGEDVTQTYGIKTSSLTTECRGIDYVEFRIPKSRAKQIAEFYDCVFDAEVDVLMDPSNDSSIAIVGFGSIDANTGRSSQSLIFREITDHDEPIPPYDGHHIAMYVGESLADFEKAFKNAEEAGVIWVNTRFSDKASNLNGAKRFKQFRFKNLIDIESGKKIFELEHEVRCVTHDAWPGP